MTKRPFRSPPHIISDVALVGGGTFPQPGEISLGHNGILFLDELPEFKRTVLEVMRQPLEYRVITLSRAKSTVDYSASLMDYNDDAFLFIQNYLANLTSLLKLLLQDIYQI